MSSVEKNKGCMGINEAILLLKNGRKQ